MKIMNYIVSLCFAILLFTACEDEKVETQIPNISFKEATFVVSEDAERVEIPLELTSALNSAVELRFKIDPESIEGGRGGNFATYSEYIYLESDAVRGNLILYVIDNDYPNANCSFDIEIIEVKGSALVDEKKQTCRITILDDDSKQSVSVGFDTVRYDVGENVGVAEVPIVVRGLLSGKLSATVEATAGTAIENEDFVLLDDEVMIVEGEDWGVVRLQINDKSALEEDRSFFLKLKSVDNNMMKSDSVYAYLDSATIECEVTIKKVSRSLEFNSDLIMINENSRLGGVLRLQLTSAMDEDVKVIIKTKASSTAINGVHYKIDANENGETELLIPRGKLWEEETILVINDTIGTEDFEIDFEIVSAVTTVSNRPVDLVEGTSSKVVIKNDDTTVGLLSGVRNGLIGSVITVPVKLEGLKDERVTVKFEAISDGDVKPLTHFILLNDEVVFNPETSSANLEVQILQPNLPEGVKSFSFKVLMSGIKSSDLGHPLYYGEQQECDITVVTSEISLDMKVVATIDTVNTEEQVKEGAGNGMAMHMLDGKTTTYWHSSWSGEAGENRVDKSKEKPMCIVELDKEYVITATQILLRDVATPTSNILVEASVDKINWSAISKVLSNRVLADYTSAKYLRISSTDGMDNGKFTMLTELKVWAADQ